MPILGGTTASSSVTLADRGAWATATAYAVGDVVTQSSVRYVCKTAHTAGTFATDLAAARWTALDPGAAVPLAQSGQTPAQEPVGLGSAASVGTLPAAARADHVHVRDASVITSGDVRDELAGPIASLPRWAASSGGGLLSGQFIIVYLTATRAGAFTQVRTCTTATASGTPTSAQIAVFSVSRSTGALTLLAQTANDTALWSAANTVYTKTLDATLNLSLGDRIAVALGFVGVTAPTVAGVGGSGTAGIRGIMSGEFSGAGDRLLRTATYSGTVPSSLTDAATGPPNNRPTPFVEILP